MTHLKNKKHITILLATLSAVFLMVQGGYAQPSNQDERHELSTAEKQDLKRKEQDLRDYLSTNPRVAEAHLSLGNNYWAQGRDGKPIRHYLAAIKLNPNYAEAYYNLANVFFVQGEHEQAAQAYSKAIELKPSFAPAHNGLGNALLDEKKYGDAIESYQKAISLNPDYKEANYNLCAAYVYAAKYQNAISACKKAAANAEDARTYNNLGNAYFRTKQFDEALTAYKRALELSPQLPEAHFNIAAISLVHTKNKQEALNRQKMLEVLDPQKSRKLSALIKSSGI
jgi:protein O-GlcNAc transferase